MKIEIDVKELVALICMIREQREPVCNLDSLANEIAKNLPQKFASYINYR
mgnify:CR=1 FL=1